MLLSGDMEILLSWRLEAMPTERCCGFSHYHLRPDPTRSNTPLPFVVMLLLGCSLPSSHWLLFIFEDEQEDTVYCPIL
jgi:hypothetical protein